MIIQGRLENLIGSRLFRWFRLVLSVVVGGGLAWLVTRSLDWAEVAATIRGFSDRLEYVFLAVAALLASGMLRAARWRVLMPGEPASFWQVYVTQNTGIGINNLLPIRMMSEPVQLILITRRYKTPFSTALASLVAGNVMDIFATVLLLGLGLVFVSSLRGASIQLAGFVILAVVTIGVLVVAAKGLGSIPVARNARFFQQVATAVGLLRERPMRLALSFGATTLSWGLMGMAGWLLAQGVGFDLNLLTMVVVLVAASFFTSAAPSLPGGIGAYHWAVVYTLGLLGIDQELATTLAFMMHLLVFAPPTAIALYMLSRVGAGMLLKRDGLAEAEMARNGRMAGVNDSGASGAPAAVEVRALPGAARRLTDDRRV
ncbi:MAG: lysylphosphatidylglycerol synthase transmembrane domain-containing protein [Chloroflexota bacterium]|nr:lysylphosphatidylglycerol synthase transmembrane domain-containing protein [Chloroflexota bacterium]